jgi:hypothetical protein
MIGGNDPAARAAKDEAMAQVEDNANEEWKEAALDAVWDIARTTELFTSEDVRKRLEKHYPDVRTHELRALGPVMRNAAKRDWIEKDSTGFYSATRHMAMCQVWRSKVLPSREATG